MEAKLEMIGKMMKGLGIRVFHLEKYELTLPSEIGSTTVVAGFLPGRAGLFSIVARCDEIGDLWWGYYVTAQMSNSTCIEKLPLMIVHPDFVGNPPNTAHPSNTGPWPNSLRIRQWINESCYEDGGVVRPNNISVLDKVEIGRHIFSEVIRACSGCMLQRFTEPVFHNVVPEKSDEDLEYLRMFEKRPSNNDVQRYWWDKVVAESGIRNDPEFPA